MADILTGASLSRANFYHYFASKYDVLAALLSNILEETYQEDGPWQAEPGRGRARSLDASLRGTVQMWSQHGPVVCAAIENMYAVSQIATAWAAMREQFVTAVAEQIAHEREAGRAQDGPPAGLIATMLVGGVERTFYVGTRGLDPRLPTADRAVRSLTEFTAAGIYGTFRLPGERSQRPEAEVVAELSALAEPQAWAVVQENDTAEAILHGVGELLQEMALDDISVARICKRSEVSRATFYFYFASKEACFAALFGKVVGGVVSVFVEVMIRGRHDPEALRSLAGSWLSMGPVDQAVIRTAVHEWARRPEVGEIYLAAAAQIMSAVEVVIGPLSGADSGREAELSASLFWTLERTVAGALAGEEHLADTDAVARTLGDFLVTILRED